MSVAAAIRMTSADEERVIRQAADFARQQQAACFVISVVNDLPYGTVSEEQRQVVMHNLRLIAGCRAAPVMQEGSDVAKALLIVAQRFGVRTLFLRGATAHSMGPSIAEQLLLLDPPFDVVMVSSE
jgi:K+-sensing histidine kinase KdpD